MWGGAEKGKKTGPFDACCPIGLPLSQRLVVFPNSFRGTVFLAKEACVSFQAGQQATGTGSGGEGCLALHRAGYVLASNAVTNGDVQAFCVVRRTERKALQFLWMCFE